MFGKDIGGRSNARHAPCEARPEALSGRASLRATAAEAGQATAEYAILAFMTVALFMVVFEQVWTGILDYYQDLASFIALPIP